MYDDSTVVLSISSVEHSLLQTVHIQPHPNCGAVGERPVKETSSGTQELVAFNAMSSIADYLIVLIDVPLARTC